MFALLAVLSTFSYGTLVGWFVHWSIHQKWAGFAHKAHMTHHLKLYPPSNLVSEKYRNAGVDNSTFLFTPVIVLAMLIYGLALRALGASPAMLGWVALESLLVGAAHDHMHTLFHLKGTWLLRMRWFRRLRAMHFLHHRNMKKNLGIFFFGWDAVFRTLRKA